MKPKIILATPSFFLSSQLLPSFHYFLAKICPQSPADKKYLMSAKIEAGSQNTFVHQIPLHATFGILQDDCVFF